MHETHWKTVRLVVGGYYTKIYRRKINKSQKNMEQRRKDSKCKLGTPVPDDLHGGTLRGKHMAAWRASLSFRGQSFHWCSIGQTRLTDSPCGSSKARILSHEGHWDYEVWLFHLNIYVPNYSLKQWYSRKAWHELLPRSWRGRPNLKSRHNQILCYRVRKQTIFSYNL